MGPLPAIAEGLRALPPGVQLAYVTATDVPFLAPGWIGRLEELLGDADIAMPHVDGFDHPLAALYRKAAVLPACERLIAEGRLRPVFLLDLVRGRRIPEDELRAVDPALGTLRNLNSPDDYEAALADAGLC
jgi:molybdopterin-guanine dinucleotide biosynthesis protein A